MDLTESAHQPRQKLKRKTITLATKLDIIQRFEAGERAIDISKSLGLKPSTVRTTVVNGKAIRECAKLVSPFVAHRISKGRITVMSALERRLCVWIDEQNNQNTKTGNKLSVQKIQAKAIEMFGEMKQEGNKMGKQFVASLGWFNRFKRKANLNNNLCFESPHNIDDNVSTEAATDSQENYTVQSNDASFQLKREENRSNEDKETSTENTQSAELGEERRNSIVKKIPKQLSSTKLSEALEHILGGIAILSAEDPIKLRSAIFSHSVYNSFRYCYGEINHDALPDPIFTSAEIATDSETPMSRNVHARTGHS